VAGSDRGGRGGGGGNDSGRRRDGAIRRRLSRGRWAGSEGQRISEGGAAEEVTGEAAEDGNKVEDRVRGDG
jgi:hypothetical protein